ncbi:MAG: hypothetical protein LBC68_11750, partial [Prevotellaceae bacterium]|nr:hypothetical protein [Prevotellaceae bacterium]
MFLELLFGDFFCIAQEKESSFITLKSSYQVPKDAVDANEMKVWDLFDLFMKRLETNEELKLLLK